MVRYLFSLVVVLALALPVAAQQDDIQGVIRDQIAAFQQDDFETAFTFAAPNIRRIFRTPDNFGMMVQRGYPMVHRPADVTFEALEPEGAGYVQKVMIRDQRGGLHLLAYRMEQGPDGWRIAGVQILEMPGLSA